MRRATSRTVTAIYCIFIKKKREDARGSNSLVNSVRKRGAICKIHLLARRKYLTNLAPRVFRAIAPTEFRVAALLFTRRGGRPIYKRALRCNAVSSSTLSPSTRCLPFSVFVAENCNFPRREGMRLSVDGFLNANNSGNRNHRRQSLPSPPFSLSLSFLLLLATRRGRCFTSQGWKLKGRVCRLAGAS